MVPVLNHEISEGATIQPRSICIQGLKATAKTSTTVGLCTRLLWQSLIFMVQGDRKYGHEDLCNIPWH